MVIEGAAAVAVAAYIRYREHVLDQNVAIIITGRNIEDAKITDFLQTRFIADPKFNPSGEGRQTETEDSSKETD